MTEIRPRIMRVILGALAVVAVSTVLGTGVAAANGTSGPDQAEHMQGNGIQGSGVTLVPVEHMQGNGIQGSGVTLVPVEHMQGNGVAGSREGESDIPLILAA